MNSGNFQFQVIVIRAWLRAAGVSKWDTWDSGAVLATIGTVAGADSASSVSSAAKCSAHCMVKKNGWQQNSS